jgi:hypothetical protein
MGAGELGQHKPLHYLPAGEEMEQESMISYTPPAGLTETRFGDGQIWYRNGSKPIRSVSKILNVVWPMPPDLPQWYLDRGRMVHAATVLIDNGTLDWDKLDERIKPFCDAYLSFKDTAHPEIEARELAVVHPSLAFGARLDAVYRIPGMALLVVTDLKCGLGKEDRYWCQVAACAMALDELHVHDYDLALLNLDNKGNPHFTVADHPGSWINRWREILEKDVA